LHSVNTCILAKTAAAAGVISFAVTFAAWRAERSPKGEAWWARQEYPASRFQALKR